MSLSTQFLDELRARTMLSALIGRTLKLQKAGAEWKACCPFHQEKTASFYVNDDKSFYHCFGCSAHGDAIRWLTDSRGLEFLDAVRELADAAGMQMPARDPDRQDQHGALYEAIDRAQIFFREQIMSLGGAEARAYLDRRKVGPASIEAFGLGFAPEGGSRLRQALGDLGDRALIEAGLLVEVDDREPYDRFRGRLIFPIRDPRGRVVGFGGRLLKPGEPKYLNSPASPIFDKGRSLFNLDRAAPAARRAGRLIVVEGYMDAIGLADSGIEEVVAPNGTALSEAQIGLLWRYADTPILCFDGDKAGRRAGLKAAERALPGLEPGRSLAFASLPAGQDPDDIARAGGAAAIERILEKVVGLAELIWRHEASPAAIASPERRAGLRQKLLDHAGHIRDASVRLEYEREFKDRISTLFRRPNAPGRRKAGRPKPSVITRESYDPQATARKMISAVLRGLARYPDQISENAERIGSLPTFTDAQRQVRDLLLDHAFSGGKLDQAAIEELFPEERGWRGLRFSFNRKKVKPEKARSDLSAAIDLLSAQAEGIESAQLATMAREARPSP